MINVFLRFSKAYSKAYSSDKCIVLGKSGAGLNKNNFLNQI